VARKHKEVIEVTNEHEEPTVQLAQVRINGKVFLAPIPYGEGHVLSAAEADVLNQTYRENLRNNFAGAMRRAAEKDGRELVQADFDAYVAEYSFEARATSRAAAAIDPVEIEERALALAAIKQAIKAKGIKFSAVAKEKVEELVAGIVAKGQFRRQAEVIVAERKSLLGGDDVLGELDLTPDASTDEDYDAEAAE